MNAHQRRKLTRKLNRTNRSGSQHRLVRHWADLAEVTPSKMHRLELANWDEPSPKPSSGRDTSHLDPIIAELRALPEDEPN